MYTLSVTGTIYVYFIHDRNHLCILYLLSEPLHRKSLTFLSLIYSIYLSIIFLFSAFMTGSFIHLGLRKSQHFALEIFHVLKKN